MICKKICKIIIQGSYPHIPHFAICTTCKRCHNIPNCIFCEVFIFTYQSTPQLPKFKCHHRLGLEPCHLHCISAAEALRKGIYSLEASLNHPHRVECGDFWMYDTISPDTVEVQSAAAGPFSLGWISPGVDGNSFQLLLLPIHRKK